MALPKLNSANYELSLPSTGKTIKFRPFLVKEQKALMIAQESEDEKVIESTFAQIINDCVADDVDPYKMPQPIRDLCKIGSSIYVVEYLCVMLSVIGIPQKITGQEIMESYAKISCMAYVAFKLKKLKQQLIKQALNIESSSEDDITMGATNVYNKVANVVLYVTAFLFYWISWRLISTRCSSFSLHLASLAHWYSPTQVKTWPPRP